MQNKEKKHLLDFLLHLSHVCPALQPFINPPLVGGDLFYGRLLSKSKTTPTIGLTRFLCVSAGNGSLYMFSVHSPI